MLLIFFFIIHKSCSKENISCRDTCGCYLSNMLSLLGIVLLYIFIWISHWMKSTFNDFGGNTRNAMSLTVTITWILKFVPQPRLMINTDITTRNVIKLINVHKCEILSVKVAHVIRKIMICVFWQFICIWHGFMYGLSGYFKVS